MAVARYPFVTASYLVLLEDDKILLLKRANTGYEDGKYSLVAGHVDPGENFTGCIIREALEEAGIILNPQDLEVVHVMHRNTGKAIDNERVDVFFTARSWSGTIQNREPHKCDSLSWFALDDLPKDIVPYVSKAIGSIRNKEFYGEFGWQ